ncbi:MAG: hypothetical protein M3Y27_10520 [Acidobacteriota bacterium]|nr:hypothetical protein [Acidobacteriota bacterium]
MTLWVTLGVVTVVFTGAALWLLGRNRAGYRRELQRVYELHDLLPHPHPTRGWQSLFDKMNQAMACEREQRGQPMHNRLMALWASTKLPESLSAPVRHEIIDELWLSQQADGGWTMMSTTRECTRRWIG